MAAEKVTPETINFLSKHGRGLICLAATPGAPAGAGAPADGRAEHGVARHVLHRVGRCGPRHLDRHLRARPRLYGRCSIDPESTPADLARPATCSRSRRDREACSSAPATPRPSSISAASRACTRPASSARSWTTTARWPGCRGCGELPADQFGLTLVSIADLIAYRRRHEKLDPPGGRGGPPDAVRARSV